MDETKANLTLFLSVELESHVIQYDLQIGISGGFDDAEKMPSAAGIDVAHLRAAHEEADTRILLHAVDTTTKGMRGSSFSAETQMYCCTQMYFSFSVVSWQFLLSFKCAYLNSNVHI